MGVPSNILVPFMGVEFDSSRAFQGSANLPIQGLIFGQKTSTGTGAVETPYTVTNADEVGALAGFGSMAHRLAIKWFKHNQGTNVDLILLADAVGTSATTTLTFTGPATADGTIYLYIDGDQYQTGVLNTDTASEIAAAVVAIVNAEANVPVVASNVDGVVTFTAKNKGVAAGDVDIRLNYNAGEKLPAGVTAVVGTTTAGTVDPDVQDVLDVLGDTWYNILVSGYNDATSLTAIETYLEEQAGPMYQHDGVYITAKKGTRSELMTFASDSSRNCPYVVIIAATGTPHSCSEVAASVAGRVAGSVSENTAVPLHRMSLNGLLPAASIDRWTALERNQLAQYGVATITHSNGVQTDAMVTTFLRNAAGATSIAYQQLNTVFQVMEERYTFVAQILSKYSRAILADNASRITSNVVVLTPEVGRTEALSWFLQLEQRGIVENVEQFKKDLVCRRSTTNPNRLEWLLPPDQANQFIVGSADLQFLLQSPTT